MAEDTWTISEHWGRARKMSEEELDKHRVYYFDRWCWDTADPDDLMASRIYEAHLKTRHMTNNLLSVQRPMSGPVAQIWSFKYRYGDKFSDEV